MVFLLKAGTEQLQALGHTEPKSSAAHGGEEAALCNGTSSGMLTAELSPEAGSLSPLCKCWQSTAPFTLGGCENNRRIVSMK